MSVLAVRSLTEVLVSLGSWLLLIYIIFKVVEWLLPPLWKLFIAMGFILYAHFLGHRLHAVIFGVVVSCLICWLYLK
jgi:hypothetical protein